MHRDLFAEMGASGFRIASLLCARLLCFHFSSEGEILFRSTSTWLFRGETFRTMSSDTY